MPIYAVYNLTTGEEPTFHSVEEHTDLIDILLDEWVAGDVDMPGVMTFLRDHGVEPPMEDDDVMEGELEEEIIRAADAVRALVAEGSDAVANEFLAAITKGFRIEEMDGLDESLSEKVHDYLVLFLTSGAFGGSPKGLTREAAHLWLEEPAHQRMIQEALTGWKPAEVAVMDGEDLAEILLVGPLWVGLMETLRRV